MCIKYVIRINNIAFFSLSWKLPARTSALRLPATTAAFPVSLTHQTRANQNAALAVALHCGAIWFCPALPKRLRWRRNSRSRPILFAHGNWKSPADRTRPTAASWPAASRPTAGVWMLPVLERNTARCLTCQRNTCAPAHPVPSMNTRFPRPCGSCTTLPAACWRSADTAAHLKTRPDL